MLDNPAQNITKNRADLSQFLIHLTKNGSFRIFKPFPPNPAHYLFEDGETVEAKPSLKNILNQSAILARTPFGHFQFQIPVGYKPRGMMPLEWLQSVCFSETPLSELKAFYLATQDTGINVNKYQKYGLAFSQALIRSRGGHPIIYFDSNNDAIVEAVNQVGHPFNRDKTKEILALFESFGKKLHSKTAGGATDFRWEREWRHVGHFKFTHAEVAFGLCPEHEIAEMQEYVGNAFPFIDPDWEIEKIKQHFIDANFNALAELL